MCSMYVHRRIINFLNLSMLRLIVIEIMNIQISTIQRQANVAVLELDVKLVAHIVRDIDALNAMCDKVRTLRKNEDGTEKVSYNNYGVKDIDWQNFIENNLPFFKALQDAVLAD